MAQRKGGFWIFQAARSRTWIATRRKTRDAAGAGTDEACERAMAGRAGARRGESRGAGKGETEGEGGADSNERVRRRGECDCPTAASAVAIVYRARLCVA